MSHFSTGRCAKCGDRVKAGAEIARPTAADRAGRAGGWRHLGCAVLGP